MCLSENLNDLSAQWIICKTTPQPLQIYIISLQDDMNTPVNPTLYWAQELRQAGHYTPVASNKM